MAVLLLAVPLALFAEQGGPAPCPGLSPTSGSVSGHLYRNHFFGFTYHIPRGWFVNDKFAQKAEKLHASDPPSYNLLQALQRAPEAVPDQELDYSLQIWAQELGPDDAGKRPEAFIPELDQMRLLHPPTRVILGGVEFVRKDYHTMLRGKTVPISVLTAHLVTLRQGHALGFVFVADNENSLEDLVDSMHSLRFIRAVRPRPASDCAQTRALLPAALPH